MHTYWQPVHILMAMHIYWDNREVKQKTQHNTNRTWISIFESSKKVLDSL
jgi:hypothetical protein